MSLDNIETHPVQSGDCRPGGRVPTVVTLAAYQVYCKVFGAQRMLIEGDCRGGFGVNELIAFLYARSFPPAEWGRRVDEALSGMKNL